jgi:hypothetical protein
MLAFLKRVAKLIGRGDDRGSMLDTRDNFVSGERPPEERPT